MHHAAPQPKTYGLLAEFTHPRALVHALERVQGEGYGKLDAFTPYPIEEVNELVAHHKKSKVPLLVLLGGIAGGLGGFALQVWSAGVAYPLNVGGRPLFSWPAFIPVTFETTVLLAAFSACFGMFILNGLPQPYHPVFNVKNFERASVDRYFLLVEAADPRFDSTQTRSLLEGLGASEVHDVDP
ncbi:MAG: DUF3341 domain-containing protein [Thermoanaerobaculia bacterium]|nr:DUF3341 domain-containing protein [Thermoanaerobaculia bacterium]